MRVNIATLEDMVKVLECKFADLIYEQYKNEIYSLKGCKLKIDLDTLYEYIDILKVKLKLLKYKYKDLKETEFIYPSKILCTSLEDFYQKELILNNCDKKFLEKIKRYL